MGAICLRLEVMLIRNRIGFFFNQYVVIKSTDHLTEYTVAVVRDMLYDTESLVNSCWKNTFKPFTKTLYYSPKQVPLFLSEA